MVRSEYHKAPPNHPQRIRPVALSRHPFVLAGLVAEFEPYTNICAIYSRSYSSP